MNNKNLILILIILLLGVGTYFLTTNPSLRNEEAAMDSMEEIGDETMEATDAMEEEAMEEAEAPEDALVFELTEDSMAMYVAQKRFLQREDSEIIGTSAAVTGEGWITPDGTEMMLEAEIDLTALTTDSSQRDQDVLNLLDFTEAYISFDETGVQNPIVVGQAFSTPILAVVSINGVGVPVEFAVDGTVTETAFSATGVAAVPMSDFGIEPPSLAGVFTVDDLIELRFDVVGEVQVADAMDAEDTIN